MLNEVVLDKAQYVTYASGRIFGLYPIARCRVPCVSQIPLSRIPYVSRDPISHIPVSCIPYPGIPVSRIPRDFGARARAGVIFFLHSQATSFSLFCLFFASKF